jgi:starch phosphorylase
MSSPAYGNRPSDTAILDALTDLALDLRWSFNHSAGQVWERLDAELRELTHNPWLVLANIIPGKPAECCR